MKVIINKDGHLVLFLKLSLMSNTTQQYKGIDGNALQYEALFNNPVIGILLTNQNGEIININSFAENQFGYKPKELIGKSIELLIPQKQPGKYKNNRHVLHYPPSSLIEKAQDIHGHRKDGSSFLVNVSLSQYTLEGNYYSMAFIVDITNQKDEKALAIQKKKRESLNKEVMQVNLALEKKVEDRTLILHEALQKLEKTMIELKEANEREKELGKLKSQLVTMASHEFRSPLSTILTSIDLIKKYNSQADEENRNRHILKIQQAVKDLTYIMDNFLSLGKLEEGSVKVSFESIAKQDLINHLEEIKTEMILASRKEQRIELSSYLQQNVFNVDRKLLRNIMLNLISNAIKYSPERSTINIHCSDETGVLQISVRDEGIGISVEEQEHLFERFFRAGNALNIQGTGLGLHIIRRYLDLMGGDIRLTSKLNEGTLITIYIP
jgi:PAS domain S-box-containing protein